MANQTVLPDAFTRADENPIASPWSSATVATPNSVASSQFTTPSTTAYWYGSRHSGAGTFGDDQFAAATFTLGPSNTGLGYWGVRIQSGVTGYVARVASANTRIYRCTGSSNGINPTGTILTSISVSLGNTAIQFNATGSSLEVLSNGTATGVTATDATYTGGRPDLLGVAPGSGLTAPTMDDWSCGNLVAGSTTPVAVFLSHNWRLRAA